MKPLAKESCDTNLTKCRISDILLTQTYCILKFHSHLKDVSFSTNLMTFSDLSLRNHLAWRCPSERSVGGVNRCVPPSLHISSRVRLSRQTRPVDPRSPLLKCTYSHKVVRDDLLPPPLLPNCHPTSLTLLKGSKFKEQR